MSSDYEAVCFTCRRAVHLGQRMGASIWSFGYGSNDAEGRVAVWRWLDQHLSPPGPADGDTGEPDPHDVRVMGCNSVPEDVVYDEYELGLLPGEEK